MELIAPVGNWDMLVAAIEAGADSVYFGVNCLNMRARARSFELSELGKVVNFCHERNVKAYLTLNTIVYDDELEKVSQIVSLAKSAGVDAIICWDFSVIDECIRFDVSFHISTQASVSNFSALKKYVSMGAKAIVLARELSLEQIREIKKRVVAEKLDVKIECFVHGAMCVAVSGRCFTSQFLYGKSANRGECLQPCRRSYLVRDVEEDKELVLENKYVMSPKDLCTLEFVDKLFDVVDMFKIEGRNRSPEYVKYVTSAYRTVIDAYNKGEDLAALKKEKLDELEQVYNRKFHSGFYNGLPTNDDWTDVYGSAASVQKKYVGFVRNFYKQINVAEVKLESFGLSVGDKVMVQGNRTGCKEFVVDSMQVDGSSVDSVEKGLRVGVKVPFIVRENDKVFVLVEK